MRTIVELAAESRGLPKEFIRGLKKAPFVFVHAYPNLDRVLAGMDLIARAPVDSFHSEGVIALNIKGLKGIREGAHVFVGLPGIKGVAKGYVEKIENKIAYVVGMGQEMEK